MTKRILIVDDQEDNRSYDMAYVIKPSLDEPSPYPSCKIRYQLAPGQKYVFWRDVDGGRIPTDWQPSCDASFTKSKRAGSM